MATFIPAVNTAEVVVGGTLDGQMVNSVHNFNFPSALTTSILSGLATSVITNWIAQLRTLFVNGFQLNSVKATDLTTSSSPTVTVNPGSPTFGGGGAGNTPLNSALVISERTLARGRSYRGRCYSPAIPPEFILNAGSVTTAYQAAALANYVAFFNAVETDSGCTHVVLSRRNGGVARVTGVMTPISSYLVEQNLDSQRNRLVGRGV